MTIESPTTVILLYLIDIELCYQLFFENLMTQSDYSINLEISKLWLQKKLSKNKYIDILCSTKKCVHNSTHKKFRIRLIYNNIFKSYDNTKLVNISEIRNILILLENKIIQFLKDYFCSYPYNEYYVKNLLDKIIEEKTANIEILKRCG